MSSEEHYTGSIPISTLMRNCSCLASKNSEKVLIAYSKLKAKHEKKVKENKILKETLDGMIINFKQIEDNQKMVQNMYNNLNESIKLLSRNKAEDFNTGKSTNDQSTNFNNSNSSPFYPTQKNSQLRQDFAPENQGNKLSKESFFIKKVEEVENCFSEINKNYNFLVQKYKMLKSDKEKVDEKNMKILSSYAELERSYDEVTKEYYARYEDLKRFKEIDRCLMDFTINSFVLKTEEPKKEILKEKENDKNPPCIKCEPIPTFAKFLNKYTGIQK